tara:strand:- start:1151 stop:1846 length:696 start_codon:yes stop_codon:yes gene_type:complete
MENQKTRTKPANREEWLKEAARIMWPWVKKAAKVHKQEVDTRITDFQFSVSLQGGRGMSGMNKAIGHIQYKHSTGNGKHSIRICPTRGGRLLEHTVEVAYVLLHELVHAATPNQGHRGNFPKICTTLGFAGKPTANYAEKGGELFKRINNNVVKTIGKFPHKKVNLPEPKSKGSRLIKMECVSEGCGMTLRVTRQWINTAYIRQDGFQCPCCHLHMIHDEYHLPYEILELL